MDRHGVLYREYLEAVVLSLLSERKQNGYEDYDRIEGIEFTGETGYYIPYNIKEELVKQNPFLVERAEAIYGL